MSCAEASSTITQGMDMEGILRFHATAMLVAPSGETTPGLSYAEDWQDKDEGRRRAMRTALGLLEQARPLLLDKDLSDEIGREVAAIRAALQGEDLDGMFHLQNWNDKPHRVLYDAVDLMDQAADALAGSATAASA